MSERIAGKTDHQEHASRGGLTGRSAERIDVLPLSET
jgi:hypothetical protein